MDPGVRSLALGPRFSGYPNDFTAESQTLPLDFWAADHPQKQGQHGPPCEQGLAGAARRPPSRIARAAVGHGPSRARAAGTSIELQPSPAQDRFAWPARQGPRCCCLLPSVALQAPSAQDRAAWDICPGPRCGNHPPRIAVKGSPAQGRVAGAARSHCRLLAVSFALCRRASFCPSAALAPRAAPHCPYPPSRCARRFFQPLSTSRLVLPVPGPRKARLLPGSRCICLGSRPQMRRESFRSPVFCQLSCGSRWKWVGSRSGTGRESSGNRRNVAI